MKETKGKSFECSNCQGTIGADDELFVNAGACSDCNDTDRLDDVYCCESCACKHHGIVDVREWEE